MDRASENTIEGGTNAVKRAKCMLDNLKKSQAAFIEYRPGAAANFDDLRWEGGSIRPLMMNSARLSRNIDRIRYLELLDSEH